MPHAPNTFIGHDTGIWRYTKDLDLFLQRDHLSAALTTLAAAGYEVHVLANHWLAHARLEDFYVDLITGFGGWRAGIDAEWYRRGQPITLHGQPARVAPVEEMIWIKSYVMHRERFDGADIVHLIQGCRGEIVWLVEELNRRQDEQERPALQAHSRKEVRALVGVQDPLRMVRWVTIGRTTADDRRRSGLNCNHSG